MLFGFGRTTHTEYMYNLRPFSTIKQFLDTRNYNSYTQIINLAGNIGVFIPFGILLPLVCQGKYVKQLIRFLSGLLVLETIQLITRRGSFDIDDFLLNTIGFTIGYGIYKVIFRFLKTNIPRP
jgi:glycopeptide antibiotics resistance protein